MSILVTRPSPPGRELVSRLRATGAVAWSFPLIEFTPGRELSAVYPALSDALGDRRSCCLPSRRTRWNMPMRTLSRQSIALAAQAAWFCHWPHQRAGLTYRSAVCR
jgi:hypothetical protein